MPKISINYTPELIDSAIKEHIEKYMNVTGDIEIEYMHRRKTKKVSADIILSELKGLPTEAEIDAMVATEIKKATETVATVPVSDEDCTSLIDPEPEEDYVTGDTADLQGAAETVIGFEDLPKHEQEEALGEVSEDPYYVPGLAEEEALGEFSEDPEMEMVIGEDLVVHVQNELDKENDSLFKEAFEETVQQSQESSDEAEDLFA